MEVKMVKLLPHQKEAVRYILKQRKCILADDMGLGKTLSSIVATHIIKKFPVVVICPPAVKNQWKAEVKKVTKDVGIFSTKNPCLYNKYIIVPTTMLNRFLYFVSFHRDMLDDIKEVCRASIKYNANAKIIFRNVIEKVYLRKFKCFIIDESHFLRNQETKQSELFVDTLSVDGEPDILIFLTGTPIVNRPQDLSLPIAYIVKRTNENILKLAEFDLLFPTKRAIPIKDLKKAGFEQFFQANALRRDKSILNLPPKVLHYPQVDFNTHLYDLFKKYFNKTTNPLTAVSLLYEVTSYIKLEHLVDKIKEIIGTNQDRRCVIFAYHTVVQDILSKELGYRVFKSNRDIAELQSCNDKVVILSLRACGTGVNLQQFNMVIFAELYWTPSELEQAEGRVHRIGQKNQVDVYYCIGGGIDDILLKMLHRKEEYINLSEAECKKEVFKKLQKQVEENKVLSWKELLLRWALR